MDYTAEVQTKLARVRGLMQQHNVGTLWLRRTDNVAWITGGVDVAINTADSVGVASVVITQDRASIVTNTIEGPRLRDEDRVEDRGFELQISSWEQSQPLTFGTTLGVDFPLENALDLSVELRKTRMALLPVEIERARRLGRLCGDAMRAAVGRTNPGMTEWQIAAALSDETYRRGVRPIVVLIATDERIHRFRHPLPTGKTMDRYAMLVLCGRLDGLVCSVTRLVHTGTLPDDLRRRMRACAEVDGAVIAASQPGVTLGQMFATLQDAYKNAGYDGEWRLHHQGGTAGYGAREFLALPGEQTALAAGMLCAWNPSITGVKSEDTVLVTGGTPEILTVTENWPTLPVTVGGMTLVRPVVLER